MRVLGAWGRALRSSFASLPAGRDVCHRAVPDEATGGMARTGSGGAGEGTAAGLASTSSAEGWAGSESGQDDGSYGLRAVDGGMGASRLCRAAGTARHQSSAMSAISRRRRSDETSSCDGPAFGPGARRWRVATTPVRPVAAASIASALVDASSDCKAEWRCATGEKWAQEAGSRGNAKHELRRLGVVAVATRQGLTPSPPISRSEGAFPGQGSTSCPWPESNLRSSSRPSKGWLERR